MFRHRILTRIRIGSVGRRRWRLRLQSIASVVGKGRVGWALAFDQALQIRAQLTRLSCQLAQLRTNLILWWKEFHPVPYKNNALLAQSALHASRNARCEPRDNSCVMCETAAARPAQLLGRVSSHPVLRQRYLPARSSGGATKVPVTAYAGIGAGNPASPNVSRINRLVSKYTCQ